MDNINFVTKKLRKGYIYREEKGNKIISIVYKDGKFIFMIELKNDDDFYSWYEIKEKEILEKISENGNFIKMKEQK